jgi:PncC family amidohydrolase
MQSLLPLAEKIAARLIARKETIAIAESSTGGLIAAALLSVPGASAYFLGGAVVYTRASRAALLGITDAEMAGKRASTEFYALLCAKRVRERHGATWGLGETGATGPTGNRYGDAAGHSCMAVVGPVERAMTLETGSADRRANMDAFAKRALELFLETISAAK